MESPAMLAPTPNVVRPSPSVPFVHRYYILLKVHYFLFFSSFGMLVPILNITLRGRGLSDIELSYINIIIPFLVFFTNPLFGYIADRSRRYLTTFNLVLAACTILYTIIFLLPTVKTRNIQANVVYDPKLGRILNFCASEVGTTKCAATSECGCSYKADCTSLDQKTHLFFNFSTNSDKIYKSIQNTTVKSRLQSCGIQYDVPVEEAIKNQTKDSHLFHNISSSPRLVGCVITCTKAHLCQGSRHTDQTLVLLAYSLLFILAQNLLANAIPLGASIGIATILRPESFGGQRVFGTIGFGIAAFLASRVYEIFKTEFVFIIMFSITTLICIIITSFIRLRSNEENLSITHDEAMEELKDIDEISVKKKEIDEISIEKKKKKKKSLFGSSSLLQLLKRIDVLVFISLTFVWGMSYAGLDPYLFLYIDEIAGCKSYSIIGWMSLVSSIAEVTGFFLANGILKCLGPNLSSIVILLAFTIRFGGYYLILNPYFIISMETMHFFNFGILYVLIVQKADAIAPPGLAGTLQGVALGVIFGLGRGIGLLIASFIYTLIQPRVLFLIIALFNLTAAVIYSLYFLYRRYSKKSSEKNKDKTIDDDAQSKKEPLMVVSFKDENTDK